MQMDHEDTIAAIATPLGRAALGIVRISGKKCRDLLSEIFVPIHRSNIVPFRPIIGRILLKNGNFLDEAVLTFYEKPNSYTREDLAEISCHGNPFILEQLLQRVLSTGARLANAGEFTYRAFLNGRLDLVQAEAVRDLIESDSAYQAELALNHLNGRLSKLLQDLKAHFIELIALMEGNIDFSEEQHYDFINREESLKKHDTILAEIRTLIGTFERGRLIREGFSVVIAGRPNVGKSCLFNALLGQDRAIVTSFAGTTRDYIRERISLGGYVVNLLDTAGIRPGQEEVEEEGIRRSRQVIANADLVVFLVDGSQSLEAHDYQAWEEVKDRNFLMATNKIDLPASNIHSMDGISSLGVSAKTGAGVDKLLKAIEGRIEELVHRKSEDTLISSVRHRDLLSQAAEFVSQSRAAVERGVSEELPLIDLHNALARIGEITGEVTIEDIYSHIFSHFCIGK